ncbi:MAG: hypothetical protein R3362_04385 [Rhodothermales bacterium]|nr:hypothetical protein [Rhodothermales bacterium]
MPTPTRLRRLLVASAVFGLLLGLPQVGCDSDASADGIGDNCDIAYASPSDTYAKFVNTLSVHIDVEYDAAPASALINRRSCDLLAARPGRVESFTVQRCDSGDFDDDGFPVDCGFGGATRSVSVSVAEGETETVTVDGDFF